ncbi:Histone-lysine N-methyltransferase SETMAR [Eumeta japonica]|uniref:Histone-lysine N-methyltransferase SETMAR n=1 Tax=Eumeta variegata TaxID=151549 RepID=A0A4C1U5D7_EUMVA|nr:Histone-lysine N-methyltransferase SETMAR [Eumeta japonica]
MNEFNVEIQYIMKFYYKKGKNATQASKKICDFYGPNAVSVRLAQDWVKRFQSGNFDVRVEPRSGRPVTDKVDAILEKVEQHRYITSYDRPEKMKKPQNSFDLLKKAGYTKKLNTWVPHELTERRLMNRVLVCDSLVKPNRF